MKHKKIVLSFLSFLMFLGSTSVMAANASNSCSGYFTAGNSVLYRLISGQSPVNKMLYVDTTFACNEGTCFYGILQTDRGTRDVIDGHFDNGSFYFARLIRNDDGRGWKKILHHQGNCDRGYAEGEFFESSRDILGRFVLMY